jgi:hypothetical protein
VTNDVDEVFVDVTTTLVTRAPAAVAVKES